MRVRVAPLILCCRVIPRLAVLASEGDYDSGICSHRLSNLPETCYSITPLMTPAPTVWPPSRMANRRPSSIAIGWISSPRHRDVVSRHYHLDSLRQLYVAGHVRRPEVELRTIALEERGVPSALFLRQDIDLCLELRVRRDRSRLRDRPAALDVFALYASQQQTDVVSGLALVHHLAEHLDSGQPSSSVALIPTISTASELQTPSLDSSRRDCPSSR